MGRDINVRISFVESIIEGGGNSNTMENIKLLYWYMCMKRPYPANSLMDPFTKVCHFGLPEGFFVATLYDNETHCIRIRR